MFSKQAMAAKSKRAQTGCPEEELLLCCARTRLKADAVAKIRELVQKEIDWSLTIDVARFHGVMPLVYWHLHTLQKASIPTSVMEQLNAEFQRNKSRNLFLARELVRIMKTLKVHDIPAIAYKGPVLTLLAYENIGLRTFGDVDIIVHKEDLHQAKALLLSCGYVPRLQLNDVQEKIYLASDYHYSFVDPIGFVTVELHWAVWKSGLSFSSYESALWGRARSVCLCDAMVTIPAPEDMLLLSCMHGTKHKWPILRLICDVAELCSVYRTIDWNQLFTQSQEIGLEKTLLLGLQLASDLLDAPLPEEATERLRAASSVGTMAQRIEEALSKDLCHTVGEGTLSFAMTFENYGDILGTRLPQDRIRSLLWLAFTPNIGDYDAFPLPERYLRLYYVLHPVLLAVRYVRWRVMRRRESRVLHEGT